MSDLAMLLYYAMWFGGIAAIAYFVIKHAVKNAILEADAERKDD